MSAALAFPAPSGAAQPMIRAGDLAPETFAARLAARPDAISLAELYESAEPSEPQSRRLAGAFSRAQSAFLDSSLEEAERAFREVTKLARESDWRDPQRRAISFSFMRLAQLAATSAAVEERVEAAAAFAPDLRPDEDAFPPPLLSAWDRAAARLKTKNVSIAAADKFPGYDVLKVDGRRIALRPGAVASVPPGPHRISALSSAHPYFSQVLTASQIDALRIDQAPLASGDCAAPRLRELPAAAAGSADVLVAFEDCVRARGRAGWREEDKPPAPPNLERPLAAETGGPGAPAWTRLEEPAPKTRSKTWIWIAAAAAVVVVGFVAYREANKPGGDSSPPARPAGSEGL